MIEKQIRFYLLLCVIGVSSCAVPENITGGMQGEWDALWVSDPNAFPEIEEKANLKMNGKVFFSEDGSATLHAYGYQGCVFNVDTMRNVLRWRINDDTLDFINEKDLFTMSYKIKDISDSVIHLNFMEDIDLYLTNPETNNKNKKRQRRRLVD
ncbi:MAG: hypothetical protein LAT68_14585 [Cyclobacteriaceae bacterium]|nr:hypothetical protein [Cyclobacteriaceae bacterium]MCH8517547.1 hypothetical protein [Cyclobacteriaceae bacterium]